ncbi:MAG TPA: Ig-like domain-containing protein [Gemmataceae bacterium]|nr:Ig-like domain-containing protein [Gemmataceae bacterium]
MSPLFTLGPGTHIVQGFYEGSANDSPSDGSAALLIQAPTSATIASLINPSGPGQAVTFPATALGRGATPTGNVQFQIDGSNFGAPVPLSGGVAQSLSTTGLPAGSHRIQRPRPSTQWPRLRR